MLINRHSQLGLSLIEAMVSLLVISIGLLGIASLQISAMKQNSSAYWQTQAVMMAYDMADRVRSNKAEINNYIGVDTEKGYDGECITKPCTTAEMLTADAAEWETQLSTLPSGRGMIQNPVANQLSITVMWDDEGTGATGTNCSNDSKVDLTCYTITMSTL